MNKKELLEKHNSLKLQIELVPQGCWFTNVRSNVTKKEWDFIRKHVYIDAGYRCEICNGVGSRHPLECHEVWSYDIGKKIQKIEKLQALCPACHEVKHFGFAVSRGFRQRALAHFIGINSLESNEATEIIQVVFEQWIERCYINWNLNLDILKNFNIDISRFKKA